MTTMADAVKLGVSEAAVRVANYQDGTFQAIVKHRNATLPWAVVVDTDPDKALADALAKFADMHPAHRVRKRPRSRPRVTG